MISLVSECLEPNMDFQGSDIARGVVMGVSDPHACRQECQSNPSCLSFIYELTGNKRCVLKDAVVDLEQRIPKVNIVAGMRDCDEGKSSFGIQFQYGNCSLSHVQNYHTDTV